MLSLIFKMKVILDFVISISYSISIMFETGLNTDITFLRSSYLYQMENLEVCLNLPSILQSKLKEIMEDRVKKKNS